MIIYFMLIILCWSGGMADTVDSKSTEITRTGSSPVFSTNNINILTLIGIIFYKLFLLTKKSILDIIKYLEKS